MPSSSADRWVRNIRDLVRDPDPGGAAPAAPGGDRFEILGPLGEGGAAVVHRARDRRLGREVALKILREPLGAEPDVRERFRREAAVAAGLSHPHVVAVYDAGESEGRSWLVMELVDGRPLSDMIRRGDRTLDELLRILEKAARGVGAAHRQGIVHRDLKPANILMTREGEPKVADFGLAHVAGSAMALTRAGSILGTPLYMAPEQVRGATREVSRRTDVYALGAVLYEAVTGRPPHQAESVTELYGRIAAEDPVSPRRLNRGVARDLETIILKALDKDPDRRYATADALADDLKRHLDGEPITARPVSAAARLWRKAARHRRVVIAFSAIVLTAGSIAGWAIAGAWRADNRSRALACLQQGQALFGRGELDKAIARYDESIRLDPRNPEAYNFRGVTKLARRDPVAAIADFDEAIRIDPGDSRHWTNRGTARHHAGDLAGAEADFAKSVEVDPANWTGWFNRGVIRRDLGKLREAAADFEQSLRVAPPEWGSRETAQRNLDEVRARIEH